MNPAGGIYELPWGLREKLIAAAILLLLVSGGFWLLCLGDRFCLADLYYEPRAREAMQSAVDACGTRSRQELARRVVEAEAAIRKVSNHKGWELREALENELRLAGCW